MKYWLQIYSPGNVSEPITLESATPFGAIHVGDRIETVVSDRYDPANLDRIYRVIVVAVKHHFADGKDGTISHGVAVYTAAS